MKFLAVVILIAVMITALIIPHYAYAADVSVIKYDSTNQDYDRACYGVYWEMQTFTPSYPMAFSAVKLYLKKTGSPSGNTTVNLYATESDGDPTGTSLGQATLANSSLTGSYAWYTFSFNHQALQAATKYAVVIAATSADVSNMVVIGQDDSSPSYTGGGSGTSSDSGVTWTAHDTEDDIIFDVWGTEYTYLLHTTAFTEPVSWSDLSNVSANLRGYVSDYVSGTIKCMFEFGLDTTYGTLSGYTTVTGNNFFNYRIINLSPNTLYHFRARNYEGTVFGEDRTFTTRNNPSNPTPTSTDPQDGTVVNTIGCEAADPGTWDGQARKLEGTVTNLGKSSRIVVGFDIGTDSDLASYYRLDDMTTGSTGSFYRNVDHLLPETTYYYRAYGWGDGESVGAIMNFTTSAGSSPTNPIDIGTPGICFLTTNSPPLRTGDTWALVSGTLDGKTGQDNVTVGFTYGTTSSAEGRMIISGVLNQNGSFQSSLVDLTPNTTYYYKAVGNNGQVNSGSVKSFKTLSTGTGTAAGNPLDFILDALPDGMKGTAGKWIVALGAMLLLFGLGAMAPDPARRWLMIVFPMIGFGAFLVSGWLDWWIFIPIALAAGLFTYNRVFRPGS